MHTGCYKTSCNGLFLPHVKCKTLDCDRYVKGRLRRHVMRSLTAFVRSRTLHMDRQKKQGALSTIIIFKENSRLSTVRPVRFEADAASELRHFIKYFGKKNDRTVLVAETDGNTTICCSLDKLEEAGGQISVAMTRTPESSGLGEQIHLKCMSLARACPQQWKLPAQYRSYPILHVADWINWTNRDQGKSLYELLFGHPSPTLKLISWFECHIIFRSSRQRTKTLQSRAVGCLSLDQ